MLLSRYFFACLQDDDSSFLLFRVAMFGLHIMYSFSRMHRLQRFVLLLYGCAWATVLHVILYLVLLFFCCYMYLLSSVWCCLFWFLKDALWLLYLLLNSVVDSPMYVSFFVLVVTVAWCIMFVSRHLFFSGHLSFCLQLHSLVLLFVVCCLVSFLL